MSEDASDFFASIPSIEDAKEEEGESEEETKEVGLKPRAKNEPTAEDQLTKERLRGDDCLDLDKEFSGTRSRWQVIGSLDF